MERIDVPCLATIPAGMRLVKYARAVIYREINR
jgi:hypothetical protein